MFFLNERGEVLLKVSDISFEIQDHKTENHMLLLTSIDADSFFSTTRIERTQFNIV